jgi:lipopolysaccharide export LptBFGC system permease protein LptF
LTIYLTPAALAISLPIGMLVGTALGLNGRMLSRRLLGCVLLVAVGVSAAALANVGWVVPASNQLYREELMGLLGGQAPLRGDRELTLIELRRAIQHPNRSNPERHARQLGFLYHQRLALALAPLTFAVCALVLTTRRRIRRAATVIVTFVVIACTVALWILGQLLSEQAVVPPLIGAWLSQIVLVHATILIARLPGGIGVSVTQTRA